MKRELGPQVRDWDSQFTISIHTVYMYIYSIYVCMYTVYMYTYVCLLYILWHCTNQFCCGHKMCSVVITHKLTRNPWPCFRPAMGSFTVLSSPSDRSMSRHTCFWLVDSFYVSRPRSLIGLWAATQASVWSLSRACPWHQEAVRTRTVVVAVVRLLLCCHHPLFMNRATTEFSGIRTLKSVKQRQ